MDSSVLYFENVTFRRDSRQILKGVTWKVKEHERWALLGLNGSGKSTLLGMIPAYTFPTSGKVQVFGHTFGKYVWEKVKRRVGFVSSTLQEFSTILYGETLYNVVLSGKFGSIGIYEHIDQPTCDKAQALIHDFGLDHVKQNIFLCLSQGEQRLALIARALMNNPDLLVLDEPCASLDVRAREHLLRLLESKAQQDSKPFVYVTHAIDEIIPCISHVALMEDGVITVQGPKKEVLTDTTLSSLYHCRVKVQWQSKRPFCIIQ